MHKLLNWLDKHFLEAGIGFLLFFIPLYPKLPLIDVSQTWVYIRAEDFLVALVVFGWLVQVKRGKVSVKLPLAWLVVIYWLVGGVSLGFSFFFISPHLVDFSRLVALLHYLRRIEYMILFFVIASTIKNLETVKRYLLVVGLALLGVCIYGFGQKFLSFPAFLTMNEEFAKGIPIHLPPSARISSTFAGHYDLAAYLVLMISLFSSLIFSFKKKILKFFSFLLVVTSFLLLLFTASRISFIAYLGAMSLVFWLHRRKWLIVPVVLTSLFLMSIVGGSASRFSKTFRLKNVVYDAKTGHPIAVLQKSKDVGKVFSEGEDVNKESLPVGSGFLVMPLAQKGSSRATQTAAIKRSVMSGLKTATRSSEIATISGEFLIKRAVVYDISFTTRLQGTWPRALEAFYRNPLLGSGYSSIKLAADNSYLRALGETGLLGLFSFLSILFGFFLLAKQTLGKIISPLVRGVIIGMVSATFGLMINAALVDAFEASKVAFYFWLLLGLTVGVINLFLPNRKSLWREAFRVAKLPVVPIVILAIIAPLVFFSFFKNYFVGDDFTWLRWAAQTKLNSLGQVFLSANGFFYRPLAKVYFFLAYPIFGLRPQGYHLVSFALHFGITIGVYFLALLLTKKKLAAFLAGVLFLVHPVNAESIFWISSTSHLLASFFFIWGFLAYFWWRRGSGKRKIVFYFLALAAFILGLVSHECMVVFPLALIFWDLSFNWPKRAKKWLARMKFFVPFLLLTGVYFWLRNGVAQAHGLSGDYNYNLIHLPFNFVGNLVGYFGELVAGVRFVYFYDLSRSYFRVHQSAALGLLVILALLAWRFCRRWRLDRVVIFLLGWMVILLLPFLGLGNIAERYIYLADAGFFIILAMGLTSFFEKARKYKLKLGMLSFVLVTSSLLVFYILGLKKAEQEWFQAGETANKILLALGSNYSRFPAGSTLYFVNLPIRQGRAWIFPVGLKDGLWFIYKNDDLEIKKISNLAKAKMLAGHAGVYVFVYKEGGLSEIK